MSDTITLRTQPREISGKKVKQLRAEGLTPVVLYGPGAEPVSLQAESRHLRAVLDQSGLTQIIDIEIEGEEGARRAIARAQQLHPTRLTPLHADFMQINPKVPLRTRVPVRISGETPEPVRLNEAQLVILQPYLRIRCLPDRLPSSFEIDCSDLTRIGQLHRVRDLDVPEGVKVLTDPDKAVVRLSAIRRLAALLEEEIEALEGELEGEELGLVEGELPEGEAGEASEGGESTDSE